MSSESKTSESGSLEWSGMNSRYKVKWNIPVEKFEPPRTIKDETVLAQSRLVKIKGLDDLAFCLELRIRTSMYSDAFYGITIKQTSDPIRMPTEPYYAFAILEGQVYKLNLSAPEVYLRNPLFVGKIKRGIQRITVYCVVCINSSVRFVMKDDGDVSLENILPQERRIASPQIEAFVFGGEIPKFTIETAEKWVKEADELGAGELKTFCEAYLKSQIRIDTVWNIMDIAVAFGMANLYKECRDSAYSWYKQASGHKITANLFRLAQ